MYAGIAGRQVYMPWASGCDLVLRLGPLNSDVNTFGFSTIPDPKTTITFERDSVEICGTKYQNLHIKSLLRRVLSKLDKSKLPKYQPSMDLGNPREQLNALPPAEHKEIIQHDTFWRRLSNFFRPGDIILTETGTPSLGGRDFVLPPHTTLINSSIWLSIGYMLGACQGAALAQREMITEGVRPQGRTILFEGDGSLQMTAQAFSDIIRNRLDVIVFVINNNGYTIERWIHGMEAHYNDCQPWRYLETPKYFGAPENDPAYPVQVRRAEKWGDLKAIMADPEIQRGRGFCMIEVIMPTEDAPDVLKKLVKNVARRSSAASADGDSEQPDSKRQRTDRQDQHVEEKALRIAG
jgi:pyruvate decarboxylase